jgi:predicted transcriptional regulator
MNEWQVIGIKEAIESLDHDGSIPHEEIEAWISSWGRCSELPVPKTLKL